MAIKRKVAAKQGGVSRRETTTPPKKVKRKVPTEAKAAVPAVAKKAKKTLSPVVQNIQALVSQLSQAERVYYTSVRDLVGKSMQDEVLRYYDIGKQLLECQMKFPQSDAHKTIVLACSITDAHGRLYRKLAERFPDREEIESYVAMANPVTGWHIPLTTLYSIAMRSESRKQREKMVQVVIEEQMSQTTFDQRYPQGVNDNGDEVEVRVIRGASVIKRVQSSADKLVAACAELSLDTVKADFADPDIKTVQGARESRKTLQSVIDAAQVAIELYDSVIDNYQTEPADEESDEEGPEDDFEEDLQEEDDGFEDE